MNRACHRVATMCRVLGVSPSGYYAWRQRPPSPRQASDAVLSARIRSIHRDSRGTYGRPRVHAELADNGWRIGGKRAARLMRAEGIAGVSRRQGTVTTVAGPERRPQPDLVERDFTAQAPDELYVADITYIPTWSGFLYLAIVLDVFSRRVVGWRMATHLRSELVTGALEMALWQRRPNGVIHHSDQGCQYSAVDFGLRCQAAGVRPSMGSVGDCYDNGVPRTPIGGALREMGVWPPGIGLQDRVPNYVEPLGSRALVVSVDEKAPVRCQVGVGKTNASESLMTRRKATNRHQNRVALLARDESRRCLLTGWMVSGVEVA